MLLRMSAGKTSTIAIDKDLLEKIHELAHRDQRTVKAVVSIALEEYFRGREVQ